MSTGVFKREIESQKGRVSRTKLRRHLTRRQCAGGVPQTVQSVPVVVAVVLPPCDVLLAQAGIQVRLDIHSGPGFFRTPPIQAIELTLFF